MTNTDQFWKKPENIQLSTSFNFKSVHEPLKKIYDAILPKLDAEKSELMTYFLISNLLKTSYQTYRVITRLVADSEKNKFPIQAHMLSRSVIDAMFVVVALLDNPDNTRKYEVAGFREFYEKFQQQKEKYKDDPSYKVYLDEKVKLTSMLTETLKLTPEESLNPSTNIPYWPIPGQFFRKKSPIIISLDRLSFLKEIYKWHYSEPSGVSHLDWEGMAMTVFASMPEYHWDPGKYESDAVYTGMLFLLIMLTEIEISKQYGFKKELQDLWVALSKYYMEVQEYYEMRYKKHLSCETWR